MNESGAWARSYSTHVWRSLGEPVNGHDRRSVRVGGLIHVVGDSGVKGEQPLPADVDETLPSV